MTAPAHRARFAVGHAGPAEAPALAALQAACFADAWGCTAIAGLMTAPGAIALIARAESGTAAGFSLARAAADEAEIVCFGVAPAWRRQGLGRALVGATVAATAAAGASALFLEVAEDNAAARALYAATGFAAVGRRRAYYRGPDGAPVAALVLRRVITPSPA